MTTILNSASINCATNTTAGMRGFAGSIEALFTAGWTQTGDSGQTAASALAAATSADNSMGYQIWRMNDSLSGSYPFYVKIEYGSASASTVPGLWFTIGTGSDGSGNITGSLMTRTQTRPGGVASTTETTYGSVASNRISYCLAGAGATRSAIIFGFERSKDTSGADTSDGFLVFIGRNTATPTAVLVTDQFRYLRPSGNTLPNSTNVGAFCPSGTTWADIGSVFGASPLHFFNGQPSPGSNFLIYMNGDTAAGSSVPLYIYGSSHTYMPIGSTPISSIVNSNTATAFMVLWE